MAAPAFSLSVYAQAVASVRFVGPLDATNIGEAGKQVEARNCQGVVFDLSQAASANSTAMAALIQVATDIEQRNGRIAFVEPSGSVSIVFDLLGMRGNYQVFPDQKTAIKVMIDGSTSTKRMTF